MKIKIRTEIIAEVYDHNIDSATMDYVNNILSKYLAVGVDDSIFKNLIIRTIHEVKEDV